MFERFTDRARKVVVLAQEEARLLDHNYIGTEHILLGMIHEGEGIAAKALESLGIELGMVRGEVEEIIGRGGTTPSGHIPFTPRAKKVLELSLRESLQLGHNYIGTEHILLGLVREGEGVGAQVLANHGADLDTVRATVLSLLGGELPPAVLARVRTPENSSCLLCGRDLWEVDRIVRAPGGALCSNCVGEAAEALRSSEAREVTSPPRVFGVPQPGDVEGIVRAFHFAFGSPPCAEQRELIEDGASVLAAIAEAHARVGSPPPPTVHIRRVRVDRPDSAAVSFVLDAGALGVFTFEGRAIRTGELWRVSRDTVCRILRMGGVECPPPSG